MSEWLSRKVNELKLSPLDVLIVGGTGGLGRAIGKTLASCGASVTVVGQTFRDEDVPNIKFVKADLSSIERSKGVAKALDVSQTDIVIFTTGIFANSKRQETDEGIEKDLAVSYLNRLAMTNIIAPKLKSSVNSFGFHPRVFFIGFPGKGQLGDLEDLNQEKKYNYYTAHMNTVAGNEALVVNSKDKFKNVKFYGLNPGIVKTNIRDNLFGKGSYLSSSIETVIGWFTYTPEQYASNMVPLLVAPELEKFNGVAFNNKAKEIPISKGMTPEHAGKIINESVDLLKKKGIEV